MAYVSPSSKSTGDVITAAEWNQTNVSNWLASANEKVTTAGDLVYATAAKTLARLGIGSTGQILMVSAGLPAWSNPSIVTAEALLSGDVALSSGTYVDGPSVSLAAGTWLIVGGVSIRSASSGGSTASISAKLWDGTNVEAAGEAFRHSDTETFMAQITLAGIATLGSTTTWKISVLENAGLGGSPVIASALNASSPGNFASWIRAIKLVV